MPPSICQFMKLSKCAYLTNYRFSIIAAKPLVESKYCTSMNFLRIKFPIKWHQFYVKNRKNDKSRQILGKWKFPQNTPLRENRFIVLVFSVVPSLASLAPERQIYENVNILYEVKANNLLEDEKKHWPRFQGIPFQM